MLGDDDIDNLITRFTEHEQDVIKNIQRYISSRNYAGNSQPLFQNVLKRTQTDESFYDEFKDWLYGNNEACSVQIRELCRIVWSEITPAPPVQGELNFHNAWVTLDSGHHVYGRAIEFTGDLTNEDEDLYVELMSKLRGMPQSEENEDIYKAFGFYSSLSQKHPELKSSLHTLLNESDAVQFSESLQRVIHLDDWQKEDFNKMIEVVGETAKKMDIPSFSYGPK